jgi:hypothetical protein
VVENSKSLIKWNKKILQKDFIIRDECSKVPFDLAYFRLFYSIKREVGPNRFSKNS